MIKVACAIILNNNKILVTQRSERMSLPLKWEFPGGKIENFETAEKCILREIKEELNIEIEILQKFDDKSFEYDTFSIILIPFLSKYVRGEIILAEHDDFKWLSSEELKGLDWAAADELILEEFLKLNLDAARTL